MANSDSAEIAKTTLKVETISRIAKIAAKAIKSAAKKAILKEVLKYQLAL